MLKSNRHSTKARGLAQYPSWFIGMMGFAALMLPMGLVHETGHYVTCTALGGSAKYLTVFSTDCTGIENKMTAVRYAGGLTASAACAVAFVLLRNKLHHGILIALASYTAWELAQGLLEGANFAFYITRSGDYVMSAIAVLSGIAAWFYFRTSLR